MILSTLARCLQTVELNNGNSDWSVNDYSMQMRRDYARELAATSQIVEKYINVPLKVDTFDEYMTSMGGAVLFDPKMRIFAYRGTLPDGRFEKLPEGMVAVDRMPFNQHQFKPDEKWPKPCFVCTGRGFIPDFKEGLSPNPVVKICDCVLPRKGLGR